MEPELTFLCFQDATTEEWVGVCLEHYVTTQAPTLADLPRAVERDLTGHRMICEHLGKMPLTSLGPTPPEYQRRATSLAALPPTPARNNLPAIRYIRAA
jgi:hypothetical protein